MSDPDNHWYSHIDVLLALRAERALIAKEKEIGTRQDSRSECRPPSPEEQKAAAPGSARSSPPKPEGEPDVAQG